MLPGDPRRCFGHWATWRGCDRAPSQGYGATLFWVRALQNLLLVMVAPMLLALGAPLTLLRDLLPSRALARLGRLLHSTPARLATSPLLLYLSPPYELTLRSALPAGGRG